MWRYNKNYQITTLPANNTTFIGVIQSIAKHEDIYYSIELGFKGKTAQYLISISILVLLWTFRLIE
jgi:hypothetical protein